MGSGLAAAPCRQPLGGPPLRDEVSQVAGTELRREPRPYVVLFVPEVRRDQVEDGAAAGKGLQAARRDAFQLAEAQLDLLFLLLGERGQFVAGGAEPAYGRPEDQVLGGVMTSRDGGQLPYDPVLVSWRSTQGAATAWTSGVSGGAGTAGDKADQSPDLAVVRAHDFPQVVHPRPQYPS